MRPANLSNEFLAHFDPPTEPGFVLVSNAPRRGVAWVVKWAAALSVLFVAACALLEFGYCVAAEQTLTRAAQAGALEATLPRATRDSIDHTIERRLARHSIPTSELTIRVEQNGAVAPRVLQVADDDRLAISLSLPADSVLPAWLRAATPWENSSPIEGRSERHVPGRRLKTASLE